MWFGDGVFVDGEVLFFVKFVNMKVNLEIKWVDCVLDDDGIIMDVILFLIFVESLVVFISILWFGNVCVKKFGLMLRLVVFDISFEGLFVKIWDMVIDFLWSFFDSIVLFVRIEFGVMMKKMMILVSMLVDSVIVEVCK